DVAGLGLFLGGRGLRSSRLAEEKHDAEQDDEESETEDTAFEHGQLPLRLQTRGGKICHPQSGILGRASGATFRALLAGDRSRLLGSGPGLDLAEDHAAGRCLQDAGDVDYYVLPDGRATLLHHHHGPIVEVSDPLTDLIALLDDLDV